MIIPVSVFIYILYISSFHKITPTISLLDYIPIINSFSHSIGITLIGNSIICTIVIWLMTFPLYKEIKNPAADDNTSGVVGALEIAKRLDKERTDFDIKIILFDNEEKGLIGSNHYITKNLKALKENNSKVINLDCIGRGENIYIMTDKPNNNEILDMVTSEMKKQNMAYGLSNIDFSDHKLFLKEGIDAISIGRYDTKRYLWIKKFPVIDWIHGSEDCIEDLDINKIEQIIDIVIQTVKRKE